MFRMLNAMILLFTLVPLSHANTTLKIATLAPDGTTWMKEMRAAAKQIKQKTQVSLRSRDVIYASQA
ncbi:MAG: hypothetical protein KZQ78_10835 [Candidatus Thiodiazotropha sp. (ex Ustalcina ferruginea)]|nr:hypothetical protein [Candidatus Thiodiazotropha sp. (ex Ustalcina ferruginea)]